MKKDKRHFWLPFRYLKTNFEAVSEGAATSIGSDQESALPVRRLVGYMLVTQRRHGF